MYNVYVCIIFVYSTEYMSACVTVNWVHTDEFECWFECAEFAFAY